MAKKTERLENVAIYEQFTQACQYIAPTWPLDQLIAVNPFWELRHLAADEVAARIGALSRAQSLQSRQAYATSDAVKIRDHHLAAAAVSLGINKDVRSLRLENEAGDSAAHWHNVSELLDRERDSEREMTWHEEIIHQTSQFCATSFQSGGRCAGGAPAGRLYEHWLESTRLDHGIQIVMGEPALSEQFLLLPDKRDQLLLTAADELGLSVTTAELYAHALLLDINGWAAWIAYLRWQARLRNADSDLMMDLLAIRMAWELALWRHAAATDPLAESRLRFVWQRQSGAPEKLIEAHRDAQRQAWLWQTAAEYAYQESLLGRLLPTAEPRPAEEPVMQAVFCIDVRSEVFRRHLEAQHPGIQTRGFAGFFGLPIEYLPAGTDLHRPQLPGLLAPALQVQSCPAARHLSAVNLQAHWSRLSDAPPSMFSLVESSGLLYAMKLLRDSFFPSRHTHPVNALAESAALQLTRQGQPLTLEEKIALAAGVLHAMGLERDFAPVVMLVGHGSESSNNPHAASLDCGACGGQTGEINVRVLAMLLNDVELRNGLAGRGIRIPEEVRFVAALHNTTTDDITILDSSCLRHEYLDWLAAAAAAARVERAARLGITGGSDKALHKALRQRARDWSQVRPEWGLAGNAAFVVAPRSRTRGVNLDARVFLHDYNWRNDADFSVLELIMTAPMIVTHWINMQYNASVADNERYGSGNKVLHNVVGGNIGVFEGNGGDLRIGLPKQSLYDGSRWMHTPMRLSVYLQAPAAAIADIYRRHEVVRQLVDNQWLYLFRLGDDASCERLYQGEWSPLSIILAEAVQERAA